MKNKGFTLIELLAVIVILAIIALIATPIILDIINNSRKEANERSIELYAKAVKEAVARYQLDGKKLEVSELKVKEGTQGREFNNTDLKVEYEGNVVCETIQIYEDGEIYLDKCKVNDKSVEYTSGTQGSSLKTKIVYFDVQEGKGCTESKYKESWDESIKDYLNSKTGYNGLQATKTTDNQNSCLKFYSFLDDGSDKINLILDHNTTAQVPWNFNDINKSGPINVILQLKTDTDGWVGTITPTNYEYKGAERPYIIKYKDEGYKARLITAQEIAQITGADKALNWDETSTTSVWYYFDGAKGTDSKWQIQVANLTNKSDYYWLFDRTKSCTSYGCQVVDWSTNRYWTASAYAGPSYSYNAWLVNNDGSLISKDGYTYNDYIGVRPVITIWKSDI